MADGLTNLPIAVAMLAAAQSAGLDLGAALTGDDEHLRPTEIAQPALLLVECALRSLLPGDLDIVAVAGHSVGEYAAAVAAHALEPADAMRLVIERGRAMAEMRQGSMCALIGIEVEAATTACDDARRDTGEIVVVANHNAPGQLVISGSTTGVEAASKLALERGARRAIPLNVSGAFHSPLMGAAAARFDTALDGVRLSDPEPAVVCNVDAQDVHTATELRERLRLQLTSPVRWIDCVHRLVELGAEFLVEVGPGKVLSGLAKRIAPDVRTLSIGDPEAAVRIDFAAVPQ